MMCLQARSAGGQCFGGPSSLWTSCWRAASGTKANSTKGPQKKATSTHSKVQLLPPSPRASRCKTLIAFNTSTAAVASGAAALHELPCSLDPNPWLQCQPPALHQHGRSCYLVGGRQPSCWLTENLRARHQMIVNLVCLETNPAAISSCTDPFAVSLLLFCSNTCTLCSL